MKQQDLYRDEAKKQLNMNKLFGRLIGIDKSYLYFVDNVDLDKLQKVCMK